MVVEGTKRHGLVGSPALWEMKRRFQIDFLRGRGLQPHHHLLDLGCGTLRGGIPLVQYLAPGHYTGIDIRPETIREAQAELVQHGLDGRGARLHAVDGLDTLDLGRRFDAVWAFSVLIHMDDAHLADALAFAARHLAEGATFLANVNIGQREPAGWQGFPVMWRSLDGYRQAARGAGLVLEDPGALGELGHVSGIAAQDAQRMLAFASAD